MNRLGGISLVAILALASVILLFPPNIHDNNDSLRELHRIAKPYAFSFISWELRALSSLGREIVCRQSESFRQTELRNQIRAVLRDSGITVFPPIVFRVEKPPYLLVVSPREKIVYLHRIVLRWDLSVEEMERLEKQVDELGLSSLVVELGGVGGTYPTIVGEHLSVTDTIDTVIEEWLHQYLAFRPLGFLYLLDSLGIRRDADIVTINETLADMVSKEVGSVVRARYYGNEEPLKTGGDTPGFDFDAEMRETRRKVDEYLSQGDIEKAERYMEERRKQFMAHGYHIRKLNQAYFAFHSIYAQDPASVSPIYEDLKELRARSPSVKHFLDKVAVMKSYSELTRALRD